MNKVLVSIFTILFLLNTQRVFSGALMGEISKADYINNSPQVIDFDTKLPVGGALVSVPAEYKEAVTSSNGTFSLSARGSSIILLVRKDGYLPFSITINRNDLQTPFKIELKKINPYQIVISDNLIHLGDNSYSYNSANAGEFRSDAKGPSFEKDFFIKSSSMSNHIYITFGSLLGLDTEQAMRLGQNRLMNSSSTPTQVFVNGVKIGELKINGDNQKIPIPKNVLHPNAKNHLKIITGMNKDNREFIDYDDIEIVNLFIDGD